MRIETFKQLTMGLLEDCMAIMDSKGMAYSGQEDKLGNFKRLAAKYKVSPLLVWSIFFGKHLDSLDAYIRGEYVDSEPIAGRIKDMINYLFLLHALIVELHDQPVQVEPGVYIPFSEIDAWRLKNNG